MNLTTGRVLLVEDNADQVFLVKHAVDHIAPDTELVVASTGTEALAKLGLNGDRTEDLEAGFDLVLLDLQLPGMNGDDVLHRIRKDERTRHLPVVVLTSSSEPNDLATCYGAGANSYIPKPVAYDDLADTVEAVLTYWLDLNAPIPV